MSEQIINLLLQIPLAGVVVIVVVLFLRHLERVTGQMITFMDEQANVNREFLKTQREQFSDGLGRLAEEIKQTRIETAAIMGDIGGRVTMLDRIADKVISPKRENV